MAAPREGPCDDWATGDDVTECCQTLPDDPDDVLLAESIAIASAELWHRTGRRYGTCEMTFRPCGTCGCTHQPCGCYVPDSLRLPRTPAVSVKEVIVDGVIVDPADYRVDDWRWLARTDGLLWPTCSDMRPTDPLSPGVFQVSYTYGRSVPPGGRQAAAAFACDLYRLCAGSGPCGIPDDVAVVNAEGVTFRRIDRDALAALVQLGIPSVDRWVATWGGGRGAATTGFLDPAARPRHRTIDTAPYVAPT